MGTSLPVIGIDFDNTIVRFDTLFHRAAVEQAVDPADVATDASRRGPSSRDTFTG